MKQLLIIAQILLCFQAIAQDYFPKDLIVTTAYLNFREKPSPKANIIATLENAEYLQTVKLVKNKNTNFYDYNLGNIWIKVRRAKDDKIGYVYGKYVKSQNIAYSNYQDCEKVQHGFWYGIYQKKNKPFLKKITPKVLLIDGYKTIQSNDERSKFLICSQKKLSEGEIMGQIYEGSPKSITIGTRQTLLRTKNNYFELACTGKVELAPYSFIRNEEKIYFLKTEISGGQSNYTEQELKGILKYGEIGYYLLFAGDLNGDGIPEIILSEGDNHSGTLYYFLSNERGELELQSTTWSFDKC